MFRTITLLSKKRALALSVHFKQPALGMKEYEILSRASAFLLSVDPPTPSTSASGGKYSHLDDARREREERLKKQDYAHDPAGGPSRDVRELGWLEFAPGNVRPLVHCVAASHVLAPWAWKDYYPHDWLSQVQQEHCMYSLEVYDPENPDSPAEAKFELSPYAIHHPDEMDLAVIHLEQENSSLKQMQNLGVEVLHLRHPSRQFEEGEEVFFEGFAITEEPITDYSSLDEAKTSVNRNEKVESHDVDDRVFVPYTENGKLIAATMERLIAKTQVPLPEGLCGGPVVDDSGRVCGIVEGIVPTNHSDERLAGAACIIPFFRILQFLEYAEKIMLQAILPAEVFNRAAELKDTGELGGGTLHPDQIESDYQNHLQHLKKHYSKEEYDAIMKTIRREGQEAMEIMNREGGDLEDVIKRVREKTIKTSESLIEKYQSTQEAQFEEKGDTRSTKKT